MSALLAGVSVLALAPGAQAQAGGSAEAATEALNAYDIDAQPLSSALSAFARQSGLSALYPDEIVAPYSAPALHGRFTRQQALAQLLSGSPLRGAITQEGALLLAAPAYPQQASTPDGGNSSSVEDESERNSEQIIVTGTRIRGAHPAGSNLTTLDRSAIERTGRNTVQDVLSTLPQDYTGSQSEISQLGASSSGRNLAFGSTVDIRGLGADATLTLVNGRRLAPAGWGNFVDISTIPLAAVDHIDVLADGASATYGSDAIAGVVNIILRDNFEGAETGVSYGGATRGDPTELNASQLFGAAWTGGSTMLGYEHRHRSALESSDRSFSATSDLRPWGGTNFSSTFTNPGNITRIGSTNVVLAIPEDQDGANLTEGELLPGVVNYRPFNQDTSLLPEQESNSFFGAFHQDLTADLTFYANLMATRREAHSDRFQNNATLIVPETNAYRQLDNLFLGQGPIRISYNMGADLGPTHFDTRTEAYSLASGLSYSLPRAWAVNADASLSHNSDLAVQSNVFQSASLLTAALASSNLATAFNPFADGSNTNAAVLQGLTFDDFIQGDSRVLTYSLRADGPLFSIWGGEVRLAIGAEQRDEHFELDHERAMNGTTTSNVVVPSASRTTNALFAELFVPVISPDNNFAFARALDLSMSIRREDASDFGSATTPKIGLTWSLNESLAMRASWGQSFKAPQFQQLFGGVGATITSVPPALDPFATNGSTGILLLSGTNPDLRPERAENWTAGFDLTPSWAHGLSFHATYFDIDFRDRISDPGSVLEALANPVGFEGVFFRNPTQAQINQYLGFATSVVGAVPPDGIEAIWDGRLTNLASLRVRGVDLSGNFGLDTDFGRLELFATASLMLEYKTQTGTGAPIDSLDTMFHPVDWRARGGINWSRDEWAASLTANYVDNYTDKISVPARNVGSWTTWDLRLSHDWRTANHSSGFEAALSVQNLFDTDPPFANNPIGYAFDPQAASPIGRFVSLEVRRTW